MSCLGDRIRVFQHPWTTGVVLWNDVEAAVGVAVADVAGVDDVAAGGVGLAPVLLMLMILCLL